MSIRKLFKNLKNWCPQPSTPLTTKLKSYYTPIVAVVTVTLILSFSFSLISSSLMSQPSLPQTIMPLLSLTTANETPPSIAWVRNYTGQENADYASIIIQTSDGGYAVIGLMGAHLYSIPEAWLIKINSQGDLEWNQTFTVNSGNDTFKLDSVAGLVQTDDGGYAIAGTEATLPNDEYETVSASFAVLFKTDSSGNVQWNQTYPQLDGASFMVQTRDGGYAIAGDYSLIKTNSVGTVQWQKSFENDVFKPNAENENLVSLAQTTDGGYALLTSDNILFKINSSGNLQWKQTYETGTSSFGAPSYISSFIKTNDNGFVLAVDSYINNASDHMASLIKTDSKGNIKWSETYGSLGSSVASLIQTSDNGYAFAGTLPNSGNYPQNVVWVVKTDSTGNLQWSQTNNNTSENLTDYFLGGAFTVNSLIETTDGGFMIAGSWNPGITGHDNAYYLAKTEPALPPSTSTPIASLSPYQQISNPFFILLIVLGVLVAVIVVALIVLLTFRKRLRANPA